MKEKRMVSGMLMLLLSLGLVSSGSAGEADGGYAGAFLQVPAGARPTAMGGAYLAVSDDGAAPLFNPAGLAELVRPLLGSSYRLMRLDRTLGYVTFVHPIRNRAAIGAHWLYAGSGAVEARDDRGELTGEEISFNNHQFTVIFAKRFERYISFGVNIDYMYAAMPEINATSVGFDLGLMFYLDQLMDREKREEFPVRDMQIGLTAKHLSKIYSWHAAKYNYTHSTDHTGREQKDDVPKEFGLGAAARVFERRLLLACDLLKNEKQDPFFHAGAEFHVEEQLVLRAGYSAGRFTAGTGYLFRLGKQVLLIDYAFTTDKADEGSEHIFSFDLQF